MNKIVIFISLVISIVLINFGMSTKSQVGHLKKECLHLEDDNLSMEQEIKDKGHLIKREPVSLSAAYGAVMNQLRVLESYSGTSMNVQLEAAHDADDIADHYVDTPYKGVKGLKIKILVDKFSKEKDMGAILDDIHLLEKDTDVMVSEISRDNNNLIVKGEIYGL